MCIVFAQQKQWKAFDEHMKQLQQLPEQRSAFELKHPDIATKLEEAQRNRDQAESPAPQDT